MNTIASNLTARPVASSAWPRWAAAIAGLTLLTWAFGWQSYPLYVMTQVLIFGIAIMGLNLLTGYTGQISLGHSAFFAIGAYATAVLSHHLGWPFYVGVPAAAVLCFVVGFLFGFPALRLPMLYLALSTFAVAVVTPQALKWKRIEGLTGGVQGIILEKPAFPGVLADRADWAIMVCVAACALGAFLLARRILGSQFGRLVDASRDQPLAAAAGGLNITAIRTQMFGLSAAFTGLAGALSVVAGQFVSPESFPFLLSISLLVGSFVGGVRSLWGAFLGAAFIVLTPNMAESLSKSAPWLIFGLALLAVVFLAPNGLSGWIASLWRRRTSNPQP
ncbi:leucine/isoleucine/valine transporter permease subunit [Variovorax boronicumulans]|uniref:branched-chain amino acid ABC transporter permease n=1 Tax=Variovorax boronicumulans TaxID=436515 RepID=UPI001C0EC56B|nr:branched-chain amino acid ABC transporter permease [Variovorax boronicumulans]PBI87791.1 leucine/isoleucine/valine transporter permease subunit [Variovorax boronicumulans]